MNLKIILAEVVKWIHNAILLFSIAGWTFLNDNYLVGYLICNLLILVQWLVNKNRCILTQWEAVLRGGSMDLDTKAEATFVGQLFHRLVGYYPSYDFVNYLSYALMLFCSSIGLIKFFYFN